MREEEYEFGKMMPENESEDGRGRSQGFERGGSTKYFFLGALLDPSKI